MALVWTHSEWREKDKRDIKSDSEQKQRVREREVARRGVMHVCTVQLERWGAFMQYITSALLCYLQTEMTGRYEKIQTHR